MNNLQTFKVCQVYADAMYACSLLEQDDLADQFLDMIYNTLQDVQNDELYAAACLINKAKTSTDVVDNAATDMLNQRTDFAEFLASELTEYNVTVDDFIAVMRFAVTCLNNGLYEAHEDGWLVSDMVNIVFCDAVLHGNTVTFVTNSRAIDLLNKLMEQL